MATPTGATCFVKTFQSTARRGLSDGATYVRIRLASIHCMANCTEVSNRGAGKPPLRAPNRTLLYIASAVLRPNQHSVRNAHLTSFGRRRSLVVNGAFASASSSSSELSSSDPSNTWCAPPPTPRESRATPSLLATCLLSLSAMNFLNRAWIFAAADRAVAFPCNAGGPGDATPGFFPAPGNSEPLPTSPIGTAEAAAPAAVGGPATRFGNAFSF